MKMKKLAVALFGLGLSALATSPVMAQSSKAVAAFNDWGLSAVSATGSELMSLQIKTANYSDLMIDVAAQCNLTTRTKGKTATDADGIVADTASATAGLGIKIELDGEPAQVIIPSNAVTFCKRSQTLTVELGQALANCSIVDGSLTGENCTLDDQSVELILDTLSTHSFNYTIPDVGPGWHTIKVIGVLTDETEVGDATANAVFGVVSTAVEEVRFVKDLQVDLTQ